MCFVLDTNSFHCVFDRRSRNHGDFAPLLDWLFGNARTALVIGGSRYRRELGRLARYHQILVELKRHRKVAEVRDDVVDAEEGRLTAEVSDRAFNDAHMVALLCASGCLLFASQDRRADRFVKMRRLYPKGQQRPSIYRSRAHRRLLRDANIVDLRNLG